MPFVTPRAGTSSASSAPGGRTTFRPPWVKDDGGTTASSSTTKPTATPWAKKTATTTTATPAAKENGEKSTATKPKATATTTAAAKKTATPEPAKKTTEPVKKSSLATSTTAAKKTPEPVNTKKAPEPIKKVAPTVGPKKPVATTSALKKKKEPTPPPESSSEEEESEEEEETEEETESEEEESEEESESEEEESKEEDTTVDEKVPEHVKKAAQLRPTTVNKKPEPESELTQRFTMEKPKLRSVVVKRDKSLKKMATEDDDEAEEGETEEERDRRRRFKLEKPKLRHVKREEKPLPSKSTDDLAKIRPVLKKVPKIDELLKEPKEEPKPEFTTKTLRKASIKREPSIKSVPAPPPLPSLVPKAPPPPPPPLAPGEKRVLSSTQKETLEKLRTRPRRRPDWSEMMKEVESGKKLRHVACNDRSQPILTCKSITKLDDKFIYETEKGNSHNKLLKQIQGGIKLKPTKTNDRSKPVLDGLRKFRRQMTIEEQLQKSQSKINMLSEAPSSHALGPGSATALGAGGSRPSIVSTMSIDEESPDELDDIDKIRDDLQSTKQMLALELRNREAQDRENKKLLAKIRTLETELEREKSREKNLEYGSNVIVATMDPTPTAEQTYVNSLKREVEDARKVSKEVEQNYQSTAEQLVEAKTEIEEQRRQIQLLERKLAAALQGGGSLDGSRRPSDANFGRDSSPELEPEVSESDPDEPEEKKVERRERRSGKELKILRSKLTKLKVKEEAAKKEKDALKQAMKKNQEILKEENKKFKKLEKEVQKMAASMKLDEDDVDGEEKDEDEEEAEEEHASEEEEESDDESEESESEESEAETGSESEPEDSPNSAKKANVEPRVKKHESRFAAMKKCNVLLQANVDNLQDQIVQVRSRATNLQDELDAVIADLGF
ncbi:FK506-binding protein 5 isoform X1 [Drosophila mauritiana]|uniref:FK506-binding protein 5 isoform X1 n=2 Tax=Drosophila mauritiana TaxID=7226 RepID=A0A6P8KSC9_DROMA|nr:FK506-binding protein 5 isoform X1 [Drosophila mauritiana]XP_033166829.1 FK506-binding protein 5 isoform X1 [Drosophila mauritiana]